MYCGRVSNLISAYIDRELSGAEMLQIRRHLDSCTSCSAEYAALARVKLLLASAPPVPPPVDPTAAVMRRWEERRLPSALSAPRWHRRWLRYPAGWQRFSLALTSATMILALIGTGLALRKPNYPDAVAANVLPALVLAEEHMPLSHRQEVWEVSWPTDDNWRYGYAPRSTYEDWWMAPRRPVTPLFVSDSIGSPYFGR